MPPEKKSPWKTELDRSLLWLILGFACAGSAFSLHRILDPVYDWDLDHEIYFGQRLAFGELLWSSEWFDRLLVSQFFFALPGHFGSEDVWFGLSILSAGLFVVVFSFQGSSHLGVGGGNGLSRVEKILAMSTFWLLVGLLPAGIAHVNVAATSLASIALVLFHRLTQTTTSRWSWALYAVGPLLACVGISLRPYLASAFVLAWLWVTAAWFQRRAGFRIWLRTSYFGVLVVFWGLLLNFLPYVWVGEANMFWEGLNLMGSGFNTPSASIEFVRGLDSIGNIFVVLTLAASGWHVVRTARRGNSLSVEVVFSVGAIGLAIAVASQHWWAHYAMLFAPMGAVLLAKSGLHFFRIATRTLTPKWLSFLWRSVRIASVAFVGISVTWVATDLIRGESVAPRSLETQTAQAYLEALPRAEASFLAPYNMETHWVLRESRHGYPHAAYTRHIDRGWFENSESPMLQSRFLFFETTESYCRHLFVSSVQVVFLPESSMLSSCFETRAGRGEGLGRNRVALDHQLVAWERYEH